MTGNQQDPGLTSKGLSSLWRFSLNLVLAAASLAVALVIIEWAVRIFLPVYDPSGNIIFRTNAEGVMLATPNFKGRQWKNTGDYDVPVAINRYGFRDHKDLRQSKPTDIFVVGDSFGFGHGVPEEKRFADELSRLINIPVFNISIPGDLKDYELLVNYARKNGANIKRLIVTVCMENDLLNYETRVAPPPNQKDEWQFNLNYLKQYLTSKVALYNMLTSLIRQNAYFDALAVKLGLSKGNALMGEEKNIYDNNIIASSFSQLKKVIDGTDAVILIIPSRGLWVGNNINIERKVHEAFVALLKNSHIPLVDLKPIQEAGGDPLQYHFRHDGHWNEAGHAQAAEALAKYFQQAKAN